MTNIMSKTELLFAYGTLLNETVQINVIGRKIKGNPDILSGYTKKIKQFQDSCFPIILPHKDGFVNGSLLELTPEELIQCDFYEGDEYCRFRVVLKSGISAWVYSVKAVNKIKKSPE